MPDLTDTESRLASKGKRGTPPRQVRLSLKHVSVWSAVKVGFLLGIAFAVVNVLVTVIGWLLLRSSGAFGQLDALVVTVMGTTKGLSASTIFTLPAALGLSLAGGVLIVIAGSLIGLVAALLYNLGVRFTGGILAGFTDR